ncbi:histone-lysine N-methyltransferase SETMAR [Plakobranchus ocellatus]|uniref:Histone-lysine N-methyltransferase SETMAR n=1 Tax=Plakobranchus ocellatus TaxID=259542 RepID=A0AAV4CKQ1_9GAST|nr:histone-lysine N-methyltransferase SETMAR [Plakobranchus ocellatus]
MLQTTDFRVAIFHWNHISSEMTCAQNTIFSCPASRGFLYDAGSGLCTPLIWLDQGPGLASALAPAGVLYLADICPKDFQAAEYGNSRTVTCVKMIRPATTYNQATSLCAYSGGYLASVKTVDKLAMVVSLAQGNDLWIGMDDKVTEGVYVWQQGSDHLTNTQRTNMFEAGEPNNGMGGQTSLQDEPRSGHPNTANNDWNTAKVDELIKVDGRVKLKEISLKLDIPKTNVCEIVHDKLGYRKVSARWVPKMSDEHKRQRVEISQILLHRCQQEGDETINVGPGRDHCARNKLLEHLITGDETWLHLSTPETKRDSMTWKHLSSPVTKSSKSSNQQQK